MRKKLVSQQRKLKASSLAFDLASSLVESFFRTAPSSSSMETENTSTVLPADLEQALATIVLPPSARLGDLFNLSADNLRAVREQLAAYNERLETLSLDEKKVGQAALVKHLASAFPKAGKTCLTPLRNGSSCNSPTTAAGGEFTCGRHVQEAHRLPEGAGPVRGRCQECKGPLDAEALGCNCCSRAICCGCARSTTGKLPGEASYSGVCTTCVAQNAALSIYTYLLARGDDEYLAIFSGDDEHSSLDLLEANLEEVTRNSAVFLNSTVALHFPPIVTPSRQRRTPSRPPPVEDSKSFGGSGAAAAAAIASQAPPLVAPAGAAPAPVTTQERLDNLLQSTAAGAANLNLTTGQIQLLQAAAREGGHLPQLGHSGISEIKVATELGSSNDAYQAQLIKALTALALSGQPGPSGASTASTTTAGEHFAAPTAGLQGVFNILGELGHFGHADFTLWPDVMGTGETKLQQKLNMALHGSSRADLDRATSLAPGNVGMIYDTHSEQNVMQQRTSQRALPNMHRFMI